MILITDNAPYHHAREIGYLSNCSKKKLIYLMVTHNVDYIDLPFISDERFDMISEIDNSYDEYMEDRGDCIRISFIPNEQIGRSSKSKPHIATMNELKLSFVKWIKQNDPSLLDCKVEAHLHDLGHRILWTPPYAPKLQPIELFWAAGKNHVALRNYYDMTYAKDGMEPEMRIRLIIHTLNDQLIVVHYGGNVYIWQ